VKTYYKIFIALICLIIFFSCEKAENDSNHISNYDIIGIEILYVDYHENSIDVYCNINENYLISDTAYILVSDYEYFNVLPNFSQASFILESDDMSQNFKCDVHTKIIDNSFYELKFDGSLYMRAVAPCRESEDVAPYFIYSKIIQLKV